MNIIIFNVKYSDNLGDGIIAECLEGTLNNLLPESSVESVDISGRESYGGRGALSLSVKQGIVRSFLGWFYSRLPQLIKDFIFIHASQRVIKNTLAPKWQEKIKKSDKVIIGGGQLFCGKLLYFPLRLDALQYLLKDKNKPIAIYSVGIDKKLEKKALKHFSTIVNDQNVTFISVRDDSAAVSWQRQFSRRCDFVTRDPGLLTCEVYAEVINNNTFTDGVGKTIGVNVMGDNTTELKQQGADRGFPKNEELLYDVGLELVTKGYNVLYFTNGLPVDEALKERIEERFKRSKEKGVENISFLNRLTTPKELVSCISKLDALIAHRLHANILAYSLKVPHVGIGWSIKVDGFFASVERTEYFVPSDKKLTASLVVNKILETLTEGVNATIHQKVINESKEGVKKLKEGLTRQQPYN